MGTVVRMARVGRDGARGAAERSFCRKATLRMTVVCRVGDCRAAEAERLSLDTRPRRAGSTVLGSTVSGGREDERGLRSDGDLVHGILQRCERTGAVRERDSPPA